MFITSQSGPTADDASSGASFADGGKPPEEPSFAVATANLNLTASGIRRKLTPGPAATLAARVRDFFAPDSNAPAPDLLVGAIPYDRQADDCLFQPMTVSRKAFAAPSQAPTVRRANWRVTPEPSRAAYEAAVAAALRCIRADAGVAPPISKVVLSRSLALEADAPIDAVALFGRLPADPSVVRFITQLPNGPGGQARRLVGATPELLISRTGAAILSHPLAGSARRSSDPAQDRAAAEALLASEKDQREHRWVVEAILDSLAPYCRHLAAVAPAIASTGTMWHLGTRIEGQLKNPDAVSSAELAAALHPTPAVGGTPRDRAMDLIADLEGYDRGFYAGAFGWTDRNGDGGWYVSLRCAEISGRSARVYAGAGIVDGSIPASEADEVSGKFQAMLNALGVDEDGAARSGERA